jgi:thioredoxin 1
MSVRTIKEAEFNALVAQGLPVLATFTAKWCGPCKTMAPLVDALATATPNVTFVRVDVDQDADLMAKLDINTVPTFQLYWHGRKTGEIAGATLDGVKHLIAVAQPL